MIDVVGLVGGECFGAAARAAIARATVIVGAPRHLEAVAGRAGVEVIPLVGGVDAALDALDARRRAGADVCVLASGDPGFFGIVRTLGRRFGRARLRVHPAPSSVALAFAALGEPWAGATVVSAHGRDLADAVEAALRPTKVAILTSPEATPEVVGKALLDAGCGPRAVGVVSRIGEPGAAVIRTDLAGLAAGTFDHLSVVVLTLPEPPAAAAATAGWGLPVDDFAHRGGMITKPAVRSIVLGKLALPATGVLWDVGAGSGSVAVEAARLRPGLRVFAVEREPVDAARVRENAGAHGVAVDVVQGDAPAALDGLPDPDRAFVGGGGLGVLDAALARLRPGGVVVATYAIVGRAVTAWERLGNLVVVHVAHGGAPAADNPVFVCWGRGGQPRMGVPST